MLKSLTKKQKIIFFIILLIMTCIIFYYIYTTLYLNNFSITYEENIFTSSNFIENIDNSSNIKEINNNTIVVYICGAVKENKVITLNENSRICDAIEAVGGLTDKADLTNINLAYILEDGEKIYIPNKGEEIETTSNSFNNINNNSKTNKININKATQTELETIPGIGPSTALKIINYRKENGKFLKIEDIKNISGIGENKFENIKNYICVK